MKRKISKKAQMEMIGLVFIVILITLGMLFMAMFALKEEPKKKIFTRKGLAYSTMSALMKTTIEEECSPEEAGKESLILADDLLEDCARWHDTYSQFECNDKHSCIFLKEEISSLLEETLGKWGKKYEFISRLIAGGEAIDLITINEKACRGERDTSGLFPIQAEDAGLVENVLFVCD